jgi:hypothetical protein
MNDVVLGLLAVLAGASFCFRGYLAMRLLIPLWGAFTGFSLGAGLVAAVADERVLASFAGWVLGLVLAVVLAGIAYLYYAVSVVVIMASTGFLIGASIMVALDVSWTWLIILVGVAFGLALAGVAIVADLPMLILVIVTAWGGASAVTAGLMLLSGALDSEDLTQSDVVAQVQTDWWWYAIYAVFAVAGIVSQLRSAEQLHLSMQEAWRQPTASS